MFYQLLHPVQTPRPSNIDVVQDAEADAREDESSKDDAHFVDALGVGTIPPESAASDLPAGERLAVDEHGSVPDAGGDPAEYDKALGSRHEDPLPLMPRLSRRFTGAGRC